MYESPLTELSAFLICLTVALTTYLLVGSSFILERSVLLLFNTSLIDILVPTASLTTFCISFFALFISIIMSVMNSYIVSTFSPLVNVSS